MHERIIGLYEQNAAAWDRQRGRELLEKSWLDRFLALLQKKGSILDVGCGGGEPIARYFIDKGYQVTGVDASHSLIALCRRRFPDQHWIVSDMRELAIGRPFDAILAWHSFFHLAPDDQRRLLTRFASHAGPGTALMFTSGPSFGDAIGTWQGEPLYHGSLDPDEYRALLDRHGFALIDHRLQDPNCGHATIWLAQMRPASGLDGSA